MLCFCLYQAANKRFLCEIGSVCKDENSCVALAAVCACVCVCKMPWMLGETMRINRKAELFFLLSIKLFYLTVRPGWMEKSSPRTIISFFSVARQTSCILDKAVNALNRMKTERKKKRFLAKFLSYSCFNIFKWKTSVGLIDIEWEAPIRASALLSFVLTSSLQLVQLAID